MTLTYSEIMIRYGELSTKGKNRMRFINKLAIISKMFIYLSGCQSDSGPWSAHAYLHGTDYEPVAESLKQVLESKIFTRLQDWKISTSLKAAVQDIMKEIYKDGLTFKISSKRSDHTFELDSRELNQTLGGAVFEAIPTIQAQMKKPDINLQVEIREEAAYISYETIKGAGGLPVGTSGKGMLMLSGGIDSPVAGYLAWSVEWISRRFTLLAHLIPAPELWKSPWLNTEVDQVWGQYPIYRGALHRDPRGNQGKSARSLPHDFDPSLYDAHYRPHSRGSRWFGDY